MELELATVDDIIAELERRKLHFLFVGVEPSNRADVDVIHVVQVEQHEEMMWLLKLLCRLVAKISQSNGNSEQKP